MPLSATKQRLDTAWEPDLRNRVWKLLKEIASLHDEGSSSKKMGTHKVREKRATFFLVYATTCGSRKHYRAGGEILV